MIRSLGALVVACALGAAGSVEAQSIGSVEEVVSVEIRPGWRSDDGTHIAGLHFRLRPGWRTYWRTAGAGGIAPQFDWSGSAGVDSVHTLWPTPRVFYKDGLQSIGYDEDFVVPLVIDGSGADASMRLEGRLAIGVCADICVPAHVTVGRDLGDAETPDPAIAMALDDRPRKVGHAANCYLRPTPNGTALTGHIDVPALGGREAVVFETGNDHHWVTDATVQRQGERLTATSEVMVGGGERVSLDLNAVRITIIGASHALELAGCEQ
ncbi:hypothetical protein JANAI61_12950 [Jannaschia sp. AI_61]|nr:hypothetical protein JANAI61_12950 [Jannaschia sp. AI_61]